MREDKDSTNARLETLTQHLDAVKKLKPDSTPDAKLPGDAARGAIDFASATAVGTLIGYGVDAWQDTSPWGLLVGLLIGTAAGVHLLFQEEARSKRRAERNAGKPTTDNDQHTGQ
jgi:F0F1-type ATP synthase assembly protein I